MRTPQFAFVALVLMLLGSTTSFADSEAHAFADSSTTYDYDADGTGYVVTLPPMGTYDWDYSLYVSVLAGIRGSSAGDSSASASASASVDLWGRDYISISVSAQWSGSIGADSDTDSASDSGTVSTRLGATMTFSEFCDAEASWDSGSSGSEVYGRSYAIAYGGIE